MMKTGWFALGRTLYAKSVAAVNMIELNMCGIVTGWVVVAALMCGIRIAFPATPLRHGAVATAAAFLPYLVVVGLPLVALAWGLRLFPRGALFDQPSIRLAQVGCWRRVDCLTARDMSHHGLFGLMASLLIGLLINVPIRTTEFLTAMPALGSHAPHWFTGIYMLMLADCAIISSLYLFAFAMALRMHPLFPRFLLLVWGVDLLAQIGIAKGAALMGAMPHDVQDAMVELLSGNLKKVLISAAIWLPYLLLSERVNLTFRHRLPA
ncbi:hypothetical protein ATN00_08975 [Sphingobium baderi]|uniref:DUF2569 domain-containing protein n=2 Tax=Sphingobium baderi TaxID=1332080 RepID=A0A0S3F4W6_9SPHN|nr:hypothetical protein ATN00_08975 [Sphingobium baderi]